jgi:hypothetical protein
MDTFDLAGALDLEAFGANLTCLHPFTRADDTLPADLEPLVDLVSRGGLG